MLCYADVKPSKYLFLQPKEKYDLMFMLWILVCVNSGIHNHLLMFQVCQKKIHLYKMYCVRAHVHGLCMWVLMGLTVTSSISWGTLFFPIVAATTSTVFFINEINDFIFLMRKTKFPKYFLDYRYFKLLVISCFHSGFSAQSVVVPIAADLLSQNINQLIDMKSAMGFCGHLSLSI